MLLLLQRIFSEVLVLDAVIFNYGPLIMDASLVLEDFFGRPRISLIIKGFQKFQREVSYFPYVVRKNEKPP